MKFRVVDNPVWLQEAEWESVVAVFSNGKAWQFSEWKHNTPVDLFHRCTLFFRVLLMCKTEEGRKGLHTLTHQTYFLSLFLES